MQERTVSIQRQTEWSIAQEEIIHHQQVNMYLVVGRCTIENS